MGTNPVGLVPQAAEERWGSLCVGEIVSLGRPRRGLITSRAERIAAREHLKMLGLEGFGRRRMNELSGGQLQRVAIARGLMVSPGFLLCDEPTSGVDPVLAGEIIDLLKVVARSGTTVIVATHDLGVVVPRLQRVLGLAAGRLVLDVATERFDPAAFSLVFESSMKAN